MHRFRSALRQAVFILVLSAAVAFTVNALRPGGLPVLQAKESVVQVSDANGTIALKDALVLSMSGRALFLDARSDWEYENGHIQNALPISPDEFDYALELYRPRLDKAQNLIAYCDGALCELSTKLADKLRSAGYANVYVLENGWTLWNNEGLPTEQGPAPTE